MEKLQCSAENEKTVAEEQPWAGQGTKHRLQSSREPVVWILLIPAGQPGHEAEDRSPAFPTGLSLHSGVTSHAFLQGQESIRSHSY